MSDVTLASKYAAENYPIALKNLAKRYQRNDDGEDIHYSELGFGDISDQQAKVALRFFADVGLIENTKHANYIPPESVVTWQRKMGERAEEAKEEVRASLMDYDVFNEVVFVLEEGEMDLEELAEQVGGMVGIDEDELSAMRKTITVFSELGFLSIDSEGGVSLPNSSGEGVFEEEMPDGETDQDSDSTDATDETLDEFVEGDGPREETEERIREEQQAGEGDSVERRKTKNRPEDRATEAEAKALRTKLEISIDATEMEADDLREKLEIIEGTVGYDEA